MPFVRQPFRARDLVRVIADAARFYGDDRGLWRTIGGAGIRELPEFWVVDELSSEYLLLLRPAIREAGGQDSFFLFTHGQLIAIWMKFMQDDTSIQRLPSNLEPYRSAIQSRFVEAVRQHGGVSRWMDEPPDPKFVEDNMDFYTVL